MKTFIIETSDHWVGVVLRLTAGFIMLPHGLQKLMGLYGGNGFSNTVAYFTNNMKLPWMVAVAIILAESIGSVLMIAGAFTRLWAVAFIAIMLGAITTTNAKNGLFMNWYGTQSGEGYEYHVLMIGICVALVIAGSGRFSLDCVLQDILLQY
jgi:putative oxidoreductase